MVIDVAGPRVHVHVVPEAEYAREPMGDRWCFHCRRRHNFDWVYMRPAEEFSYYGPTLHVEGVGPECSDLFPGWVREAPDE